MEQRKAKCSCPSLRQRALIWGDLLIFARYFQTSCFSGVLCSATQFVSPGKHRHGAEQLLYGTE